MEWGLGGPGPEMRGLASWRTEQEVLRGSCPRRCFGTYISQLGLSFPNYNKWPHLGHQPFGTRQPFSSVRACEWVRRAGSAHTPPWLGSPASQALLSSLGARPGFHNG